MWQLKRKIAFSVAVLIGVTIAGLAGWFFFSGTDRDVEVREDVFRYSFTIKNESGELIKSPGFVTYGPANLPFAQEVRSLDASHPYTLDTDEYGNRVMRFELGELPPFATRIVTVTARLKRFAEYLDSERRGLGSTEPRPLIESDAPMVQELADRLKRPSVHESAGAVIAYLANHIEPAQYIRDDKGALWALREGRGDCTEYMYAFSALSRAQQVPTLEFGGFRAPGGRLHSGQYHNWSAYYDGDRWVLVDAQNGMHDRGYLDYVVFRVFNPDAAHPLSNTHRFISMDPRIKVTMND